MCSCCLDTHKLVVGKTLADARMNLIKMVRGLVPGAYVTADLPLKVREAAIKVSGRQVERNSFRKLIGCDSECKQ
jgi:hypothetical protein